MADHKHEHAEGPGIGSCAGIGFFMVYLIIASIVGEAVYKSSGDYWEAFVLGVGWFITLGQMIAEYIVGVLWAAK